MEARKVAELVVHIRYNVPEAERSVAFYRLRAWASEVWILMGDLDSREAYHVAHGAWLAS